MTIERTPIIRDLSTTEAELLLARNPVGRLAFAFHDRVDIEPIRYVYKDRMIFGRTSVGNKLLMLAHNAWCAFETDEPRGPNDWKSVVVKGQFFAPHPVHDRKDYQRAVDAIRRLSPTAFTDDDLTPDRDVVFVIYAAEITGRASTPSPEGAQAMQGAIATVGARSDAPVRAAAEG